jgi:hypothetical protein
MGYSSPLPAHRYVKDLRTVYRATNRAGFLGCPKGKDYQGGTTSSCRRSILCLKDIANYMTYITLCKVCQPEIRSQTRRARVGHPPRAFSPQPRTNISVLPHRTGYVSLDNAFALIEGPPKAPLGLADGLGFALAAGSLSFHPQPLVVGEFDFALLI